MGLLLIKPESECLVERATGNKNNKVNIENLYKGVFKELFDTIKMQNNQPNIKIQKV